MDDTRGEISHVEIFDTTNESSSGPSIFEPTNESSFGFQSKEWSVECSKMDDTRGEISHAEIFEPTNNSSFGSWIFDRTNESSFGLQSNEWSVESTKESKEPMNEALKNIQTKESSFGNQSKEWNVESTKESKEPMNEALKNIHNLIDIYDSEILNVALADWESSEQAYRKRVHRKKKVLRNTRIEVITLTGFFLALQGLLLTAAALSSSSQCTNVGFLLAVSGLVTFCALAFVCHKEVTMRRLQSVIVIEKAVQKTFTSRLQRLRQEGKFFGFERTNDYIIKSTKFAWSVFGFSFTATTWVALAIGIFGALCLVANDRLLCHSS